MQSSKSSELLKRHALASVTSVARSRASVSQRRGSPGCERRGFLGLTDQFAEATLTKYIEKNFSLRVRKKDGTAKLVAGISGAANAKSANLGNEHG
jgi:hypothetical protein